MFKRVFSKGVMVVFGIGLFLGEIRPNVTNFLKDYWARSAEIERVVIDSDMVSAQLRATMDDLGPVRAAIASRVLLDSEQVSIHDDQAGALTARFYGIEVRAHLLQANAQQRAQCLVAYIQGHGGAPSSFDYYLDLQKTATQRDCDVLSMSMLGLGQNTGAVHFPAQFGGQPSVLHLSAEQAKQHQNYAFYQDAERPQREPLALFLSAHYYLLAHLSEQYSQLLVTGISGGGWYTTMLAALLPSIDVSVSYAGVLPLQFRVFDAHRGDYEQVFAPLWRDYDYWQIFALARSGQRKAVWVYNDRDSCCFMDPEASQFQALATEFGFEVVVKESQQHSMDVATVASLFWGADPEPPVLSAQATIESQAR